MVHHFPFETRNSFGVRQLAAALSCPQLAALMFPQLAEGAALAALAAGFPEASVVESGSNLPHSKSL